MSQPTQPCPLCKRQPVTMHRVGQGVNEAPEMRRCVNIECLLFSKPFDIGAWNEAPRSTPAGAPQAPDPLDALGKEVIAAACLAYHTRNNTDFAPVYALWDAVRAYLAAPTLPGSSTAPDRKICLGCGDLDASLAAIPTGGGDHDEGCSKCGQDEFAATPEEAIAALVKDRNACRDAYYGAEGKILDLTTAKASGSSTEAGGLDLAKLVKDVLRTASPTPAGHRALHLDAKDYYSLLELADAAPAAGPQYHRNDLEAAFAEWWKGNGDFYVVGEKVSEPRAIAYGGFMAAFRRLRAQGGAPDILALADKTLSLVERCTLYGPADAAREAIRTYQAHRGAQGGDAGGA